MRRSLEHHYDSNSTAGSWGWNKVSTGPKGKVGSGDMSRHGKEAKCSLGSPRGALYRGFGGRQLR